MIQTIQLQLYYAESDESMPELEPAADFKDSTVIFPGSEFGRWLVTHKQVLTRIQS